MLSKHTARQLAGAGSAVALTGDCALVGCPRVADGLSHGAVEVFHRDAATGRWLHERTLEAADAEPGDGFGTHIAAQGDRAIIGSKAAWVYFFRLAE